MSPDPAAKLIGAFLFGDSIPGTRLITGFTLLEPMNNLAIHRSVAQLRLLLDPRPQVLRHTQRECRSRLIHSESLIQSMWTHISIHICGYQVDSLK